MPASGDAVGDLQILHHRIVRGGGHGDRDRVDIADQRVVVSYGIGAERVRDGGGPVGVHIGDRDRIDSRSGRAPPSAAIFWA